MKRFIMTVAVALCVIVPFFAEAQDRSAVAMKIKSLTIQKEQLQNELKELERDWNRPRANMSEEELASMKERYDSLSLDKKSAILGIDLEIAELSEISNK
jgi:hypothetical protein